MNIYIFSPNRQLKTFLKILLCSNLILCFSCKQLVEVEPPTTSLNAGNVYNTDATAISVLNGIYIEMSQSMYTSSLNSVSLLCGLSSDELELVQSANLDTYLLFYKNALTSKGAGTEFWSEIYPTIFVCNSAIEGLNSGKLNPEVKKQLLGEARFMRAFCYYYLVNIYGSVPIAEGVDYKINSKLSRSPIDKVYSFIEADLRIAKDLLSSNYLDGTLLSPTTQRVRPNSYAASAMLARILLLENKFIEAEAESSNIIENSTYTLGSLENTFLRNSQEAIWQLQPVNEGWNTEEGRLFVIPDEGPGLANPVYLSQELLSSFDEFDQRRESWIASKTIETETYHYPIKYKKATFGGPVTEYSTVLRLAEQYLIRAEARIKNNNISGGMADLNIVRLRATNKNVPVNQQLAQLPTNLTNEEAMEALFKERFVELFSEWGHRWFDLRRSGEISQIMQTVSIRKNSHWNDNWILYPIPESEFIRNVNLVGHQNNGY